MKNAINPNMTNTNKNVVNQHQIGHSNIVQKCRVKQHASILCKNLQS